MRVISYPILALIVNYLLFTGFPSGGGGTGLGFLIVWPIIGLLTLFIMGIHWYLSKKGKKLKIFQMLMFLFLAFVSYALFITEPDNRPSDVIKRMIRVRQQYGQVTIDDFFAARYYNNFERIVAAKKKFRKSISDTSFSVSIRGRYSNSTEKIYPLIYRNGKPFVTTSTITIDSFSGDTLRFTYRNEYNKIDWLGNRNYMSDPVGRRDSFMNYGDGFTKDLKLEEAVIFKAIMRETPDTQYWAYGLFYWIL